MRAWARSWEGAVILAMAALVMTGMAILLFADRLSGNGFSNTNSTWQEFAFFFSMYFGMAIPVVWGFTKFLCWRLRRSIA